MLEPGEQAVDAQGERRGRHGAGEDHCAVHHREAAEDVLAEAAGADRGGDGRRAHADHGGDANTRNDGRNRQRQLDQQQQLPRRHSHRDPGLNDRSIQILQSGHRRPDNREQRVERERDERGTRPDATDEREWQQEPEEREARNRLRNVGEEQQRPAQAGASRCKNPGGKPQRNGEKG